MITRRQLLTTSAASAVAVGVGSHLALPADAQGNAYGQTFRDLGPRPAVIDVAQLTLKNTNFRTAAWTTDDLQLTLMSIPVGGEIGLEMHSDVDQFLRIESGTALVMMGTAEQFNYVKQAGPGDAILIPSGTWHNVVNTGSTPLKVYSLYGPQQHPLGTVHVTRPAEDHGPLPTPAMGPVTPQQPFTGDVGCTPYVFDIEQATVDNTYYRISAWTCDTLQLTLMSIPVGGDVGLEMHSDVDQFLRVEEGHAKVYFGTTEGTVRFAANARAGDAILIPSGTWHNVVNSSPKKPLQLYSLYGPQQHPFGTRQRTKPAEH